MPVVSSAADQTNVLSRRKMVSTLIWLPIPPLTVAPGTTSSPALGTPNASSFHYDGQPTPTHESHPTGPPRKRRRTSEVRRDKEAKQAAKERKAMLKEANGSLPKEVPKGVQYQNSMPPHPPHYQHIQWGQQNHSQVPQHTTAMPHPSWASVNHPTQSPGTPGNGVNGSNGNPYPPQNHYGPPVPPGPPHPPATGWATINHHTPHAQTQYPPHPQAQPPPHTRNYIPLQQPPPVQPLAQNGGEVHANGSRRNVDQERRESTIGNDDGAFVIDNMPKHKQRQVYGIISGIQGGLDHLQRELDALKKSLGIDDDP